MTSLTLEAQNVGGIRDLQFTTNSSKILVSGPNATNKSSILQAIAFALGSERVPVRSGTDEASVTLTIGDETVSRTARRVGGGLRTSGEAWLEDRSDRELLEDFAALFEFNPLRRAVRRNDEFESILKSPIDLDELERERTEKLGRKEELKDELQSLTGLEEKAETYSERLAAKRERAEELDAELEALRERQTEADAEDSSLGELHEERGDLVADRADTRDRIESIRESIQDIESQKDRLVERLEEARAEQSEEDIAQLKRERTELREDVANIETRIEVLQSVRTANEEMLRSGLTGVLGKERGIVEDTLQCWTCGAETTEDDLREAVDDLGDVIGQYRQEKQAYAPEIEAVERRISTVEEQERRREELRQKISQLEERRENREQSLESNERRLAEIEEELDRVDQRIEETERERASDTADLTTDIEDTRVQLHAVQNDIQRLEQNLEEVREKQAHRADVETRIEEVTREVEEITERIETVGAELRTGFNDSMDELIDILDFDRIERIWLDGSFDLVIAREVDGAVREDSLEHLAESEREMIGLVLALAGYLTYDLPEKVPVLLIDTLGAFDTTRTERLIQFFSERTEYLVVAVRTELGDRIPGSTVRTDELTASAGSSE